MYCGTNVLLIDLTATGNLLTSRFNVVDIDIISTNDWEDRRQQARDRELREFLLEAREAARRWKSECTSPPPCSVEMASLPIVAVVPAEAWGRARPGIVRRVMRSRRGHRPVRGRSGRPRAEA